MKSKIKNVNLALVEPDRWLYDERKFFYIDFIDEVEKFINAVQEFPFERRTPVIFMDRPADGWNGSGMLQIKEQVKTCFMVHIEPNILIRLYEMEPNAMESDKA